MPWGESWRVVTTGHEEWGASRAAAGAIANTTMVDQRVCKGLGRVPPEGIKDAAMLLNHCGIMVGTSIGRRARFPVAALFATLAGCADPPAPADAGFDVRPKDAVTDVLTADVAKHTEDVAPPPWDVGMDVGMDAGDDGPSGDTPADAPQDTPSDAPGSIDAAGDALVTPPRSSTWRRRRTPAPTACGRRVPAGAHDARRHG